MWPRQPSGTPDQQPSPPTSRAGARLGVILGAGAAALVSAGLVYWIGSAGDPTLSGGGRAPARGVYAPARPDAGQVARAYAQVQEVYARQGTSGVASFARACAQSLALDPGGLDFCVAFDIYAAPLVGDDETARVWRANADVRDLALARAALPPTQDPAVWLARVRELARRTSLEDSGLRARRAHNPAPGPQAGPAPIKSASAKSVRVNLSAARTAGGRERLRGGGETASVCAGPGPFPYCRQRHRRPHGGEDPPF